MGSSELLNPRDSPGSLDNTNFGKGGMVGEIFSAALLRAANDESASRSGKFVRPVRTLIAGALASTRAVVFELASFASSLGGGLPCVSF